MTLTYKFDFENFKDIRSYTLDIMSHLNSETIYVKSFLPPPYLQKNIDDELKNYGLPPMSNFLVFKRKNYHTILKENAHIDYSDSIDQFINCSVVFPVEGCEGTYMFWMEGSYTTSTMILPNNIRAKKISWLNEPKIIHTEEIVSPTLCCVNIPHDAVNRLDNSYRTTATIRLKGNPTIDQVIKSRYKL